MTNEERIFKALKGARQMLLSLDTSDNKENLWASAIGDVEDHLNETPMNDREFRLTAVELMDTVHASIMALVEKFSHEEAEHIQQVYLKSRRN